MFVRVKTKVRTRFVRETNAAARLAALRTASGRDFVFRRVLYSVSPRLFGWRDMGTTAAHVLDYYYYNHRFFVCSFYTKFDLHIPNIMTLYTLQVHIIRAFGYLNT